MPTEKHDQIAGAIGRIRTKRLVPANWEPSHSIRPPGSRELFVSEDGVPTLVDSVSENAQYSPDLTVRTTLASGELACVRLAEQTSLGRLVAVKSLLPDRRDEQACAALRREARVAGRLEHPNIVPVHSLNESDHEGPYFVMKHIEGVPWSDRLALSRGRPRSGELRKHLETLIEVCRAVEFAHSRGVIHRDIKPANVMVGEYGEVYLLDWGSAHHCREDRKSEATELAGTPVYMAPEMVLGQGEVSERTDVYLLGATLHEVLTGRPRHEGANVYDVMSAAVESRPFDYPPEVPAALGRVCNRACAAEPDDRFPSATAFRTALAEYLTNLASLDTCDQARRELSKLDRLIKKRSSRPDERQLRVQRQFGVCRSGFEQALRQWPGNADATAGLRESLELMVGYELDCGNVAGAAHLMWEVQDPDPVLLDRLAASYRKTQKTARATEQMARIQERNPLQGRGWLHSATAAIAGLVGLVAGLLVGSRMRSGEGVGHLQLAACLAGVAVACGAGVVVLRRQGKAAGRYPRFVGGFVVLLLLGALALVAGRVAGIDLANVGVMSCALGVATAGTLALTVDRSLWIDALIATSCAFLAAFEPQFVADIIGAGFLVTGLHLAWVLRPIPQRPASEARRVSDWLDIDLSHTPKRDPEPSAQRSAVSEEEMARKVALMLTTLAIPWSWEPDRTLHGAALEDGDEPREEGGDTLEEPAAEPELLAEGISVSDTLATGGSGRIRLGVQDSLNRTVAVKSLLSHKRRSERAVTYLVREARIAGRLEHPNIVPVHALGFSEQDGPFMIMKQIEGKSWRNLLFTIEDAESGEEEGRAQGSATRKDLNRHLEMFMELCRAIEFAHSRGVIHRDIKPDNVMVGRYGEVILIDWGSALLADDDPSMAQGLVGTPAYMAPELVRRPSEVTTRTDVYLLGATLHHVLTGKARHRGGNVYSVLLHANRSEPFEFGPAVPAELARICNKACAADPADRYESADAVRKAVDKYLDTEASVATCEWAAEELATLVSMADASETEDDRFIAVQRQFGVCCFGFDQALREWPDNTRAVRGLRDAKQVMAAYELDCDNVAHASLLIETLEDPHPVLVERLAVARKDVGRRARAQVEVAELKGARDLRGRSWHRSGSVLLAGFVSLVAGLVLGTLIHEGAPITPSSTIAVTIGAAAAVVAWARAYREQRIGPGRYHRMVQAFALLFAVTALAAGAGAVAQIPAEELLVGYCLLAVAVAASLALTVHPTLWVSALIGAAVTFGVTELREYAVNAIGAALMLNAAVVALLVRPAAKRSKA